MKKIISLALVLAMVFTMSVTAFAAETGTTEKNITLGVAALQGAQKSNVYYGTYKQSSDGNNGFNIDPIKWRVLSNADGKLFLLADQNLDVFKYNTEYVDVTWETSTMRSWLNGYAASENGQSTDYTSDNFIKTAFSTQELAYILQTTLENADNEGTEGGNNTDDYVFLLSIAEVTNTGYGFSNDASKSDNKRVSTNTAYVAAGGKLGNSMPSGVGEADYWRLRSPGDYGNLAAGVRSSGSVSVGGFLVNYTQIAVRPAFNLKSTSVLFTSAAKDGKTAFSANTALTAGDGYKLTLLDTGRSGFSAEIFKTAGKTYVKYQGATTGANEHITAMIVNANGDVTYYGSLKNITESTDASGTIDIDLSGMNSGDKVYILNEQWNGNYKTDYASAMNAVQISKFVENNTGSVEVTYGVSESYTATIPADITLSANGETDVEVKTSSVVVEYGKELTISVSSSNYSEDKWYLVDTANTSNKLEYSIKSGENPVASGDTVLTVAAGTTEEQKVTLKAKLVDTVTYSGTYKDTLTFSVCTVTTVSNGSDLQAALTSGGKIKLTESITSSVTVSTSTPVVLDLNGKTLTATTNENGLKIESGSNVTINDETGSGGIEMGDSSSLLSGCSNIACYGTVVINGGNYQRYSAYSLLFQNDADVTINGGIFGLVSGSTGTITINGGTIGSFSCNPGVTVYITGGTVNAKDPNILGSCIQGTTTITGGTFNFDPSATGRNNITVDTTTHTVTDNGNGTWTVTAK